MSDHDVRPTAVPGPRVAAKDLGLWAEPWYFAPRPRTRFGDAESTGRRSGGQVPSPRSGD